MCSNNLLYLPNLPFVSMGRFCCDGNPSIEHLPYPLACQWNRPTPNLSVTPNVLHISSRESFNCLSAPSAFHGIQRGFPSEATLLLVSKNSVNGLLELTFKSIFRRAFKLPMSVEYDPKTNLHVFAYDQKSSKGTILHSIKYFAS